MRPCRPVPAHLADRAFSRKEALAAGITPRMLQHPRFVEVHPSVYRLAGVELDDAGRIRAAHLALPQDAVVSHGTRLWLLGAERGALVPFHFTVARDLHLSIDGITLHRTVAMPANDGTVVTVEAAFIGLASYARLIDLVAVGDWLLHRRLMTRSTLAQLANKQPWRPGATQAMSVLPVLDGRSRSMPESETRLCLILAGLPIPAVNADVHDDDGRFLGCGDLVYFLWKLLIEYEGGQHFTDAVQIASDVDRYAGIRGDDWDYVQVTKKHLRRPKAMVQRVHRALVARGYDGPAPDFGDRWRSLFRPVPAVRGASATASAPMTLQIDRSTG